MAASFQHERLAREPRWFAEALESMGEEWRKRAQACFDARTPDTLKCTQPLGDTSYTSSYALRWQHEGACCILQWSDHSCGDEQCCHQEVWFTRRGTWRRALAAAARQYVAGDCISELQCRFDAKEKAQRRVAIARGKAERGAARRLALTH